MSAKNVIYLILTTKQCHLITFSPHLCDILDDDIHAIYVIYVPDVQISRCFASCRCRNRIHSAGVENDFASSSSFIILLRILQTLFGFAY